ncbi:MAG TPA: AAA family ATPase [Thermoanaerobaculia bacterium]|nr:AAA family ATPase [Thermoanaerobaculia bacterium]
MSPSDPSLIHAIEAAVEASPENRALRLHLAEMLADSGRPADALTHCARLLQDVPDDIAVLRVAATAAERSGDVARASSYRRLAAAIEPEAAPAPKNEQPVEQERGVVKLRLIDGGPSSDIESDIERPQLRLSDVAGMEHVKQRLELAFLAPMRNPEMRRLYGKSLRGGLLLYGPPGCGKTFIARAIAGELGAAFISIGLADVLDMYVGQSERNLHEIFENARRTAPCVLFIDEIDALGRKRSFMRESAQRTVVNQLLAEMDSIGSDNEGLFVLAATNHPWDVDSALRRPGRLDRMLLVLPPDAAAREGILRAGLAERPAAEVDLAWIVAQTNGHSGADLAHLCDSAAELAMADSIASGNVRPITTDDFKRALAEARPSTRSWFETARNYAQFANDGGMYDELLTYMRKQKLV